MTPSDHLAVATDADSVGAAALAEWDEYAAAGREAGQGVRLRDMNHDQRRAVRAWLLNEAAKAWWIGQGAAQRYNVSLDLADWFAARAAFQNEAKMRYLAGRLPA